jgi:hypothetical protein
MVAVAMCLSSLGGTRQRTLGGVVGAMMGGAEPANVERLAVVVVVGFDRKLAANLAGPPDQFSTRYRLAGTHPRRVFGAALRISVGTREIFTV